MKTEVEEKIQKACCKNVCYTRCPKRLWTACKENGSGNCDFAKNMENWQSGYCAGAEWAINEFAPHLTD